MLFAQFDVCGRFSQVESTLWADLWCPQFAFLRWLHFPARTLSVHLNPQIEGTEIVCPQFSGGRFCQVVARTGSTVSQNHDCVVDFNFDFDTLITDRLWPDHRVPICSILC